MALRDFLKGLKPTKGQEAEGEKKPEEIKPEEKKLEPVTIEKLIGSIDRLAGESYKYSGDEEAISKLVATLNDMRTALMGLASAKADDGLLKAMKKLFDDAFVQALKYGDDQMLKAMVEAALTGIRSLAADESVQGLAAIDIGIQVCEGTICESNYLIADTKPKLQQAKKEWVEAAEDDIINSQRLHNRVKDLQNDVKFNTQRIQEAEEIKSELLHKKNVARQNKLTVSNQEITELINEVLAKLPSEVELVQSIERMQENIIKVRAEVTAGIEQIEQALMKGEIYTDEPSHVDAEEIRTNAVSHADAESVVANEDE